MCSSTKCCCNRPDPVITSRLRDPEPDRILPLALILAAKSNCSDGYGPQGPQGPKGDPGPKGDTGSQGPAGPCGPKGDKGDKGDLGAQGPIGPQGTMGSQGIAGPKGDTGSTGPKGDTGPKGETGSQGATGTQGPQGIKGDTGPQGPIGNTGSVGPQGPKGETGSQGPKGDTGATGPQGPKGDAGSAGIQGPIGNTGPKGETGSQGPIGLTGPKGETGSVGPQGPAGSTLDFAFFYGNSPHDYPSSISPNNALDFPNAGPASSPAIARSGAGTFVLSAIGVYEVFWQAAITGTAQLMLRINGVIQPQTVASRSSGATQIVNDVLIATTSINSILEVIDPPGNSGSLTITPSDGGPHPTAASLVIKRLL